MHIDNRWRKVMIGQSCARAASIEIGLPRRRNGKIRRDLRA
jgi:hypothetical protein